MGDEEDIWKQRFFLNRSFGYEIYDCWLHAVSVGEVAVCEVLVGSLLRARPDLKLLVSSTTPQGLIRLRSRLSEKCSLMVFPLDFPQVVNRLLNQIKTTVYGGIETELWPNLILGLKEKGTNCILLNGRLSEKSYKAYKRLGGIFRPVLNSFSKICVINETYKDRFEKIGASHNSLIVTGNAKYEGLITKPDLNRKKIIQDRLELGQNELVFCAGSIRGGEEEPIIDAAARAKKEHPHLVCLIVPRHLDRIPSVLKVLEKRGIGFDLWSQLELGKKRSHDWIVVDVIGPLYDLYGIADCAFVGGSLVPKGGQNLMEPASWGCPVIFGPHTSNFEEAALILQREGGGIMVRNSNELFEVINRLLKDPILRQNIGKKAREALLTISKGAASFQVEIILEELDKATSGK